MCVLIPIAIILHNCVIAWFLQVKKLVMTMFDLQCWKHKARIYIVSACMAFHVDQVVIALRARKQLKIFPGSSDGLAEILFIHFVLLSKCIYSIVFQFAVIFTVGL